MKTHFTASDYTAIANAIYGLGSTESAEHVIEYANGSCLLVVQVNRRIECRDEIGCSYEGYDFERLSVVDSEGFDVEDAGCYDKDGNEIETDFDAKQLLDILNS